MSFGGARGFVVLLLLFGCGHQKAVSTDQQRAPAPRHSGGTSIVTKPVTTPSTQSQSAQSSKNGSLFRFSVNTLPEHMDPAFAEDIDSSQILNNLYEGLVGHSPDDGLRPAAATDWHVSANGTVYVFTLRKDARWSDGRTVTAHDFRRAWLRLLSPTLRSPNRGFVLGIQGADEYVSGQAPASSVAIEPIDDFTLRVTLVHPMPFFPALCATTALRPVPPSTAVKRPIGPPDGRITNGPYRLSRILGATAIELERNPRYWDAQNVNVQRVQIYAVADNRDALRMFDRGELDWTGTVDLPFSERGVLAKRADYVDEPNYGIYFIRMNLAHNWLKDNRIRHALSRAIDRDGLAEQMGKGIRPAYHFVPPGPGYESPTSPLAGSPAATKRELQRAMPRALRRPLTLSIDRMSNHRAVAQHLKMDWKKNLGIDVKIAVNTWRAHQSILRERKYHLARSGWIGDYHDPLTFLTLWTSDSIHNQTGWSDREYDGLLLKARRASQPLIRRQHLQAAEKILLQRGPVIPLFFYSSAYLLNPSFAGLAPHALGLHPLKYLFHRK